MAIHDQNDGPAREPSADNQHVGTGPAVALNMNSEQNAWQLDHFATLGSTERLWVTNMTMISARRSIPGRCRSRRYPATSDDPDAQEQEQEGTDGDETADESIVGK